MRFFIILLWVIYLMLFGCNNQTDDRFVDVGSGDSISVTYAELAALADAGNAEQKFFAFEYAYENGADLLDHLPSALQFLIDSAQMGLPVAQFNLGFLFRTGTWVEKNDDHALVWYEKAAEQEFTSGKLWTGILLHEKFRTTKEAEHDRDSERWLREVIASADTGDVVLLARDALGTVLLYRSIDDEEGWRLIIEAAEGGYAGAGETLLEMKLILDEIMLDGYEPNEAVLNLVDEFLESGDQPK